MEEATHVLVRPQLIFVAVLVCAAFAAGADLPDRWLSYSADLTKPEEVDKAVKMIAQAKAAGCTHVQMNEPIRTQVFDAPPEYVAAAERILDAATKAGIKIVPSVFSIGYSGRYVVRDPNIAAGIPVRNARFKVSKGAALPDQADTFPLANGGFDEVEAGKLAGWTYSAPADSNIVIDTNVKHSGASSLKITGLDKIPRGAERSVHLRQTVKVRPFQYYRVTVWVKAEQMAAEQEDYVVVTSGGGSRRHAYTNLTVKETQDWTKHETVFNTLDAAEVDFRIGVSSARRGTIWFDDLTVEPAGLLNVVDRQAAPFTVTSEDGSIVYAKGKDFEPVKPSTADELYEHRASARPLVITPDSRIKDGQTLLVSYYHTVLIYRDQLGCSLEDPEVFEMMDLQMKNTARIWKATDYMMAYDEIRIAGWESRPGGATLKPGELLANHVRKAIEIAHKYTPGATLYVWSDMFTPHHNAYPFSARNRYYYLVNGNWDGSWEGLPKEVVVVNWSADREGMMWFAGRGHRQIMAGYYDSDPAANISAWMEASNGVPGVIGMMYTTWRQNYGDMPEFFRLLKDYPNWKK